MHGFGGLPSLRSVLAAQYKIIHQGIKGGGQKR